MTLLYFDDFNVGNRALASDGNWVERGNMVMNIISNLAEVVSADEPSFAHTNTALLGNADNAVDCTWNNNGGGNNYLGVFLRRVDFEAADSSLYMAYINANSNGIFIYKKIAGSYTLLKSASYTLDNTTTYKVEMEMVGNTLTMDVDDSEELTVDDSSLTAKGDCGMAADTSGFGMTANDFSINGTSPGGGIGAYQIIRRRVMAGYLGR